MKLKKMKKREKVILHTLLLFLTTMTIRSCAFTIFTAYNEDSNFLLGLSIFSSIQILCSIDNFNATKHLHDPCLAIDIRPQHCRVLGYFRL